MNWDPLHELVGMPERSRYRTLTPEAFWTPSVDLVETDADFVIFAELPGVSPDAFSITANANGLVLTGERAAPSSAAQRFLRLERGYGRFTRTFEFPESINVSAITADYDRGLLTITVPKAVAAPDRRIKIK